MSTLASATDADAGKKVTAINKSMDRDDLLAEAAAPTVDGINQVVRDVYETGVLMTSWYGSIESPRTPIGRDNLCPDYEPLPDAADDNRLPWFLYWEIEWVMRMGPRVEPGMRVLDAGGTASLFSCYLASRGVEVHSIDINPRLVKRSNKLAKTMGWNMKAYAMDIGETTFADEFFDHAYSICVFEHLDFYVKQRAYAEIHRTLKPGGRLSITFDYANPAPFVFACGDFDSRPRNAIDTPQRVKQVFAGGGLFDWAGNPDFVDNGKRYLVPPPVARVPDPGDYTFGAVFLERQDLW